MKRKCDSCGKMNHGNCEDGDACDSCCGPLFNEYGKYSEVKE